MAFTYVQQCEADVHNILLKLKQEHNILRNVALMFVLWNPCNGLKLCRFEDGAQHTEGRTVALLKRSEKCTSMILHPMTEGNS